MYKSVLHKSNNCIDINSEIAKFRAKITAKKLNDMGISQKDIEYLLNELININQK